MPKRTAKISTDKSVKAFKPESKTREIPDAGSRGLHLVIQPTGRKSWALRFRRPDKHTAKLTLGPLDLGNEPAAEPVIGAPLTLAAARTLAAEQLRQRALGVDIATRQRESKQRSKQVAANTFPDRVKLFIADHAQRENRRWRDTARLLGLSYPKDGSDPAIIADSLSDRWRDRDAGSITGDDFLVSSMKPGRPGCRGSSAAAKGSAILRAVISPPRCRNCSRGCTNFVT